MKDDEDKAARSRDDERHRRRSPSAGQPATHHRTPAGGVPAPDSEGWEDPTGNYQGDELALIRSRRPTKMRLARLEAKHDSLVGDVSQIKSSVSGIEGQMKVWPELVETLQKTVQASIDRDHYTFTAKVDVDRQAAEASIDVDKKKAEADIDVEKAKALDPLEARKARRQWITKVLTIIATLAGALATGIGIGRC